MSLWMWDRDWADSGSHSPRARVLHRSCGLDTSPVFGCAAFGAIGLAVRGTAAVVDRELSQRLLRVPTRRGVRGASGIGRDAASELRDGWSTNLLAAAMLGLRRFGDLERDFPTMSPVTLTDRLDQLVRSGMFDRVPIADGARRMEYRLTTKSKAFFQVFAHLNVWAGRHHSADGRTSLSVESFLPRPTGDARPMVSRL